MSSDQLKFIARIPDSLKTPRMLVTVVDANNRVITKYEALPGLILEEYAKGPGTVTEMRADHTGCIVTVKSIKTGKVIQTHSGVYKE